MPAKSKTGKSEITPRNIRSRSSQFHDNVTKRGNVVLGSRKEESLGVGPAVIALFVFVVVGSALLQIFRGW